MHEDRFQFNRGAIRPLQALAEGWRLIKSDYWFFVGVCFVGVLIAQLAPMNILLGPAMCGIHICLLRQANGQKIKFDMLFQGFNYFGPSILPTACLVGISLVLVVVYYVFAFGGMIGIFTVFQHQGNARQPPPEEAFWLLLAWIAVCTSVLMLFAILLQGFFLFVFPLIVDREMSGWEAVSTSFRAVLANLGGVLTIIFLEFVLGLCGVLMCYFGVILIFPITFAMTAMAYRQVFPVYDRFAEFGPDPEQPVPMIGYSKDTSVQSKEPRPTGVKEKTSEGENP
jgi:hypothetical protein